MFVGRRRRHVRVPVAAVVGGVRRAGRYDVGSNVQAGCRVAPADRQRLTLGEVDRVGDKVANAEPMLRERGQLRAVGRVSPVLTMVLNLEHDTAARMAARSVHDRQRALARRGLLDDDLRELLSWRSVEERLVVVQATDAPVVGVPVDQAVEPRISLLKHDRWRIRRGREHRQDPVLDWRRAAHGGRLESTKIACPCRGSCVHSATRRPESSNRAKVRVRSVS